MNLRVALAGPSGTGKSTLAEYISKRYDLPINPVGSRSVSKDMGFASPYDVDKAGMRGVFQRRLITEKMEWEARDAFVTDRTTLDNIVYTALHDVRSIDKPLLQHAGRGVLRYTHIILCSMDVFIHTGDDPARIHDKTYHYLFETLLFALIARCSHECSDESPPPPLVLVLESSALGERRREVDEFLAEGT